jgi:hypothetical protein
MPAHYVAPALLRRKRTLIQILTVSLIPAVARVTFQAKTQISKMSRMIR